jgi:hypothetical protein
LGQARDVIARVKSTSFAPRVPPRELREHVPPARREILQFAKKRTARKNFTFRLKSGLAPTLLIDRSSTAKNGGTAERCVPDRVVASWRKFGSRRAWPH